MAVRATGSRAVVAALAGRRIDAATSKVCRFPLQNVEPVRIALERLFAKENVDFLVCSAACGADLIALEIARQRGTRCLIVLPFSVERFRRSSVVDRPGNWGPLFDQIVRSTSDSDLIVLQSTADADDAYEIATLEIVRQAAMIAAPAPALAVAVWERRAREKDDATASFLRHAKQAGMKSRSVRTC
jgi:hypothetical protein